MILVQSFHRCLTVTNLRRRIFGHSRWVLPSKPNFFPYTWARKRTSSHMLNESSLLSLWPIHCCWTKITYFQKERKKQSCYFHILFMANFIFIDSNGEKNICAWCNIILLVHVKQSLYFIVDMSDEDQRNIVVVLF